MTAVSAGNLHTCALVEDGSVWCWGFNYRGQIGPAGSTVVGAVNSEPLQVVGVSDAIAVEAGWSHTCALVAGGTVSCWGGNDLGQLGTAEPTGVHAMRATPSEVPGLNGVRSLTAVGNANCATLTDSTAMCFGSNVSGELGDPSVAVESYVHPVPVTVSGLSDIDRIGAGTSHACAVLQREGSNLACWGANYTGVLGNPFNYQTENPSPNPTIVQGLPHVVDMEAGYQSCALAEDGNLWCWGSSSEPDGYVPAPYPQATGIVSFDSLGGHTCAVDLNDAVICWGSNTAGQLGRSGGYDPVPRPVTGL